MRFLVDSALSPLVAKRLNDSGHDAVHTRDRGIESAADSEVVRLAVAEQRVIVSADTDFGTILAFTGKLQPSVIQFRRGTQRRPQQQVNLLLANLGAVAEDLVAGAIVTIEQDRISVRALPIERA